jgi:hypothetical protein
LAFFTTRTLSQTGQGAFVAGLFVLAGTQDSAAVGLSSLFVAMMLGAILFGLGGGALADRLGAGRALVTGAVARTTVIAVALLLSGQPQLVPLVAFAYSAVSQLYSPAELALVRVVAPRRPAGAHAMLLALQHTGQGIGLFVVAPIVFLVGGVEAMLLAGFSIWIGVTGLALTVANSGLLAEHVHPVRRAFDFSGTFRYLTRDRRATYAAPLLAFSEMAGKATVIAVPIYFAHDLRLESIEPLAVVVPAVLGILAGLFWAFRALHVGMAPAVMRMTLLGIIVSVVALAGLGNGLAMLTSLSAHGPLEYLHNPAHLSLAVAVPIALLLGICFVVAPIAARTVLTATARGREQGRVFATQAMLTDVLAITPLIIVGVGTEIAGARAMFLFVGAIGATLFIALEVLRIRSAPLPSPGPTLELAPAPASQA